MFKPEDTLFEGGQTYGDFVKEDRAADNAHRAHYASNHRGQAVHAGRRTVEGIRKAMSTDSMARGVAVGAGLGALFGGVVTMDPMVHGTFSEFVDPQRIASGGPGAVAGAALNAAAVYGIRRKLGDY